ncbi:MAG: hypothetical protein M3467_04900 [Actinomycetota bacterium]|nr:hypothetical protein [Actinomycetota bacterium]
MDDHELLIRHATNWAEHRKLPLDRDLLETALDLRDFHDERTPQEWPEGSAEHLMLRRWPSHGPSEAPDVDVLVQTLDTFWRFLRGTGRMASTSADPKTLTKEARRAAAGMRAACADPSRHSASKSLVEFGASIGLPLDEAGSIEELNERMQQVMEAWNALPDEERMARAPFTSAHQGSLPGMSATGLLSSLSDDGAAPLDLTSDEHGNVPFADVAEVAADVRTSPFVQQCRRLVEWVGEGKPVTATQVLRLAPAREAYAVLDLWEWDRTRFALLPGGEHLADLPPEAEALRRKVAAESFRSSADCEPLDRLWQPCEELGLIDVGRTKATGAWAEPTTDEQWRQRGMALLGSRLVHMPPAYLAAVLGTLLLLLDPERDSISLRELEDWWWHSERNWHRQFDAEPEGTVRPSSERWLHAALHQLEDTGAWRREGHRLRATALGHDLALVGVFLADEGIIDP